MVTIIGNQLSLKEFVNFGVVERQLPKLDVAGSIPVSRSKAFESLTPTSRINHRKQPRNIAPGSGCEK